MLDMAQQPVRLKRLPLLLASLVLVAATAAAADPPHSRQPAFPGAEGFGAYSLGGRGGDVYLVTTLDDYRGKQPIPGSLRAAVEAAGPRTIVFRVAGIIQLAAPLEIRNPYLTIAGQTAPGDGICLKGYDCRILTHDVIVRHIRVRPGDESGKQLDALSVNQAQDVIIDHCSVSWSVDEALSVTGEGCTNVTVQWCLISESLRKSVHHKGEHGYGSLIRTDGDITFHHNLYAHHQTRCPRPGTYGQPRGILLDFRNNVIYDWRNPAGYTSEDRATLNYIGNYLKPGPSTTNAKAAFKVGGQATLIHASGNFLEGADAANRDNWLMILGSEPQHRAAEHLPVAAVRTDTADEAYRRVLDGAGATLPARDAIDARIVQQVRTGTGRIIDSPQEVGGWGEYRPGQAPPDTDADGMPDEWERQHRLDPHDAADNRGDADGDGYTNLEEFLNGTDPRKAETP